MKKETPPPAYLVVFQTMISGQIAQVDFSTIKNPLNSRQVRRDCEAVARDAFAQLSPLFERGQAVKCVEIVEFKAPEGTEH